ncbi:hypothetical protein [Synechococcus sp. RedBA-s]|uniref:DUF7734 family protein n=1 Tax=Synechococcus sp. RedBA-s TaxID=2823741 RepID=UPI0020CE9065|nr:hypothetical protein [Synechococcus sp. RedBA-s]MCP9800455.1 hypothetical protein [Synechococcus sp. RedBA-s]
MVVALLAQLEAISRGRPDRVLRLRGTLPSLVGPGDKEAIEEEFELLIFRGFSSSVTHPTAFDPDQPALPEGASLESAELLQGPMNPESELVLAGPEPAERFLDPDRW